MTMPNDHQIGGTHYAASFQHWDMIIDLFGPSYLVAVATKYLTRYKKAKHSQEDLEKAIHYEEKLLSLYLSSGKFEHQLPHHPPRLEQFPRFAKENNLSGEMVRIFHLLLGYTSVAELQLARQLTQKLLDEVISMGVQCVPPKDHSAKK